MRRRGCGCISFGEPWSGRAGTGLRARSKLMRPIWVEKSQGNGGVVLLLRHWFLSRPKRMGTVLSECGFAECGMRLPQASNRRSRRRWSPAALLEPMAGVDINMEKLGYVRELMRKEANVGDNLLPGCNKVASLLKRWLLGTHQGVVSQKHLDSYLDEYTFRFNRRTSRYRGKLFYRLIQQAVAIEPVPYSALVNLAREPKPKIQQVGVR